VAARSTVADAVRAPNVARRSGSLVLPIQQCIVHKRTNSVCAMNRKLNEAHASACAALE